MKKNYVSPMMVGERFVVEEYVAACGDSGKIYKFQCNAPEGTLYYYPRSDGKIDGIYTGNSEPTRLGGFHPNLNVTHEAASTDEFYDGYITQDRKKVNVIVWIDEQKDYHATKNLTMDSWETAKS